MESVTVYILKSEEHNIWSHKLRDYALEKSGIDLTKNPICYGKNGKPYVDGIFFNVSHSGQYVICAISKKEIGCDIEKMRDCNLKLVKRYFSSEEYEVLSAMQEKQERNTMFIRLWTIRESYAKKTGQGLPPLLEHMNVRLTPTVALYLDGKKEEEKFFETNLDDHHIAICADVKEVQYCYVSECDLGTYPGLSGSLCFP